MRNSLLFTVWRHSRNLFTVFTCAALLSACGFALRGSVELPASVNTLAITGSDLEMIDILSDTLEKSGARVVDATDATAAVLDLTESEFVRDVRTTDSNGRATSYTLRYRVGYDVRSSKGEELQVNQRLTQRRVFDYDPLQELQSEEEVEFLREEMQEEAVLQILRRLSRIRG